MKKILNEWRKFVNETKPKHPPKINPNNPHDRAKTSFVQTTTEGPLELIRYLLSQYMLPVSSYDVGHEPNYRAILYHISKLDQRTKSQVFNDLGILLYIYDRPMGSVLNVAGMDIDSSLFVDIFNDRKSVRIMDKLMFIMQELNLSPASLGQRPSPSEIERVFKFYIMPKNFEARFGQEPEQDTDRFSRQKSISYDQLMQMNRALRQKNKRNK
tara:strand:- start:1830 stop:2468 length:639 start_codon:yes stop_codon:yes gene_type:complete